MRIVKFNQLPAWHFSRIGVTQCVKIGGNKTRQGYARKRTLKLAGYFFPGCC